MLIRLIMLMRQ